MKKLIVFFFIILSSFNNSFSKTLEIETHIIEVPNKFNLIDWSDFGDMDDYCREYDICYGIVDKNVKNIIDELNSGSSYDDIKILKPIITKYQKIINSNSNFEKNTKSLINLIKSTLKKNDSGVVFNYFKSDQNIYENKLIKEYNIDIDEIRNMSSSDLKKFTRETKNEITSGTNSLMFIDGLSLNFNKFNILKSNNTPYLIFNGDLKYLLGSSTLKLGKLAIYLSEINNKLFWFEGYCLVNCSNFFLDFDKIINNSFKNNTSTIKSTSSSGNDFIKQLNNLNDLYNSGVLTKEEFEKAKKKILN